ncbi:Ig-like domain-containing protein [Streptomyces sp. NPDC002793]|uniref:Ig-like domain-containing protein n=1 Tax=Streptomyces sp. NPDC002793 TaxID=3154432 RepID=UPI0033237E76
MESRPAARPAPGYYQPQPPPGYYSPQQPVDPEAPKIKRTTFLEANTVKGSALQGKAKVEAILTDEDGQGLPNQLIHLYVAGGSQELGSARTNDQGKATFDTGSHISDSQLMATAALSGYVAEFKGSRTYYSCEAKGSFSVSL